jgi:hypothetical protein
MTAYQTQWRAANRAHMKQYHKEYYIKNKDKQLAAQKIARSALKVEVMTHYSGGVPRCACPKCPLPMKDIRFLTLDHVDGGGAEHRSSVGGSSTRLYAWAKKNNYPLILQVLCFDCNCGKNTNGGICPHME